MVVVVPVLVVVADLDQSFCRKSRFLRVAESIFQATGTPFLVPFFWHHVREGRGSSIDPRGLDGVNVQSEAYNGDASLNGIPEA